MGMGTGRECDVQWAEKCQAIGWEVTQAGIEFDVRTNMKYLHVILKGIPYVGYLFFIQYEGFVSYYEFHFDTDTSSAYRKFRGLVRVNWKPMCRGYPNIIY